MMFLPLGFQTFLDTPTDYDRVVHHRDTAERTHRRALRQARRRAG